MTKTPDQLFIFEDAITTTPMDTTKPYVALKWNSNDVEISSHTQLTGSNPIQVGDALTGIVYQMPRVYEVLRGVHRWERADLPSLGLVQKNTTNPQVNSPDTYYGLTIDPLMEPYLGVSPHAQVFFSTTTIPGWFLPDADPTVFGTPYLREQLANRRARRGGGGQEEWVLSFVGTRVGSAPHTWDDIDSIRASVQHMSEIDSEYLETVALLTDSSQYEADRTQHLHKESLQAARIAYKPAKTRIKPVLVEKVIATVSSTFEGEHRQKFGGRSFPAHTSLGRRTLRKFRVRSGVPPINAALSITFYTAAFATPQDEANFREAEQELTQAMAKAIRAKNLGTLLKVTPRNIADTNYIVVRSPEMAYTHRSALGVELDATMTEVL